MNLDYETLRLMGLAGLLFCVIGFVLAELLISGLAILLPLLSKQDTACQLPLLARLNDYCVWQMAFLFAGLAIFATAWPVAFAVFFCSLPGLLSGLLLAWLIRYMGLNLSSLLQQQAIIKAVHYSSWLIMIILGLLAGNLLKGVPFHLDSDMRSFFLGDLLGLLNPFALLVTATALALSIFCAACDVQQGISASAAAQSQGWLYKAGAVFVVIFALTGSWITHLEGYHISSELITSGPANPLNKFVKRGDGLWLDNYEHYLALAIIPGLAFIGAVAAMYLSWIGRSRWLKFIACVVAGCSVLTAAISIFPFLLPSNRSLNSSLTIWDASASMSSLQVVQYIILALPVVLLLGWLSRTPEKQEN